MSRDLLKKNPSVGLAISVLGRPGARNDQPGGARNDQPGGMGLSNQRQACFKTHRRPHVSYATIEEPAHMPASRHASAAGKRAETMAAVMALTILIATAQSAPAQQAPEGTPAAWRVECAGD